MVQKILLNIVSGEDDEINMNELKSITEYIENSVGNDAKIIFVTSIDQTLAKKIKVTVIASGFDSSFKNSNNDDSIENEKTDSQINIFEKNDQLSEVKSYAFEKPSLENNSNEQDDRKLFLVLKMNIMK